MRTRGQASPHTAQESPWRVATCVIRGGPFRDGEETCFRKEGSCMASDMLPEMTHSMVENNLSADVWNMVDIYLHSYRCSKMVSRGTHLSSLHVGSCNYFFRCDRPS